MQTTPCKLLSGICLLLFVATAASEATEIRVSDRGEGCDYVSGAPIALPAASLSTSNFQEGICPIKNRRHKVRAAGFDSSGALSYAETARPAPFPEYLNGKPYVWFLQDVRHYTNYACTVSVDHPVTFYLLMDNRVNDFTPLSALDDPSFGPPDTEWIPQDGWTRVNTGISPQAGGTNRADYVRVREGGVNAISQFYAIYSKTLPKGGSVTLRTQFDGNMYCLVIATNAQRVASEGKKPKTMDPQPVQAGTTSAVNKHDIARD